MNITHDQFMILKKKMDLHFDQAMQLKKLFDTYSKDSDNPIYPNPKEVFFKKGAVNNRVNSFQSFYNMWQSKRILTEDGDAGPKTMGAVNHLQQHTGRRSKDYLLYEEYGKLIDLSNDVKADPSPDSILEKFSRDVFLKLLIYFSKQGWIEGVETLVWKNFQDEWYKNNGYAKKNWAWCAVYCHEVLDRAGLNLPYRERGETFALVSVFKAWAKKNGFWKTSDPQPGDMFITGGASHIGGIIDISKNYVITSEGNSLDKLRSRKLYKSKITGYIHIPDGYSYI